MKLVAWYECACAVADTKAFGFDSSWSFDLNPVAGTVLQNSSSFHLIQVHLPDAEHTHFHPSVNVVFPQVNQSTINNP